MPYWTLYNPILGFPAIQGERLRVDLNSEFDASLAALCCGQSVCVWSA